MNIVISKPLPAPDPWPVPAPLPDALPPVMPYNPDALPDALRPFVEDTTVRLGCPIEFCAVAAITAAGALIGRAVAIAPKTSDGWHEFSNLWAAAVGEPSSMKSPAINEMLAPLHSLERDEREAWEPRLAEYQREFDRWEIEKKAAAQAMNRVAVAAFKTGEQADLGDLPPEPEKPICPRIIVSDTTTEALIRVASGNPRGLLMVRDELAGWLSTFNKAGREADRAFYLETASGKNPVTVDRKGDGSLFCDPLALAMVGSIQPGPLRSLVKDANGAGNDGLLQRFGLLVWPDITSERYRLNDTRPDAAARRLYVETMQRLRTLEVQAEDEEPGLLRFTPKARARWQTWYESEMTELRQGDVPGLLNSHRVKLAGKTVLGIALACECCDTPRPEAVGLQAVERALLWAEILKTHAARLYAPQVSPDVEACRLLGSKIQAGKLGAEFHCREVYRKGWAELGEVETVKKACEHLTALGWIRLADSTGPGRPAEAYTVNPQVLS
jgi:putative DNA primase/helicase|tara:strand:- start:4431 stop:5930 length:1500 start_codon:yes stop_codon:yes gene_type:complete